MENRNLDEETFIPPLSVRATAERGLRLREEAPSSKKGGTSVGIARARDLANGRPVTISTIKRMVSFFARHEGNQKKPAGVKYDPGQISWKLWGGDEGKRWANKMLEEYIEENENDEQ